MPASNALLRIALAYTLLGVAVALPGCLISSRSRETQTGTYVSEATFNQIEPGVTTRQWVLGTLGEPSLKTRLENGEELWKWSYCKTKQSSGSLLFVFGGSSSTSTMGAAYIQFKDGLVAKSWRAD